MSEIKQSETNHRRVDCVTTVPVGEVSLLLRSHTYYEDDECQNSVVQMEALERQYINIECHAPQMAAEFLQQLGHACLEMSDKLLETTEEPSEEAA